MIDRLPPDIEALIAAERATPDPSPAVMKSVRSLVAQSVGHAPLGHAVSGLAMKLVVVAVVVASGAIGYRLLRPGAAESRAPTWVSSVETTPELVEDEVVIAQPESRLLEAPPVVTKARRVVKVVASPEPPRAELARMLTSAWQAVSAGNGARALELVEQVAALNPQGPLEEERHALEVAALRALDRRDEARSSAERFVERYPHSIHARLVRRAFTSEGSH